MLNAKDVDMSGYREWSMYANALSAKVTFGIRREIMAVKLITTKMTEKTMKMLKILKQVSNIPIIHLNEQAVEEFYEASKDVIVQKLGSVYNAETDTFEPYQE